MRTAETTPYDTQFQPQVSRTCGAACLSTVYRSLGKNFTPSDIWPNIAKENRFGVLSSTTHLMVQDALNRGFAAIAIQARQPLEVLRLCQKLGISPILNHRLNSEVPTGHYSIVIDIDPKYVVLHDPFFGPAHPLLHAELLELWQPRFINSEISGNVLIGVMTQSTGILRECRTCRTPIPAAVDCPRCKNPVALQPAALLGCVSNRCMDRMWNHLCCPSCDYTWTFTVAEVGRPPVADTLPSDAQAPSSITNDALDPTSLLGELDKFCSFILGLPAAANHPEIIQQLDSIKTSKEDLMRTRAEGIAHREVRRQMLTASLLIAQQNQEAHRKKAGELARPAPPLDGNALGRALLSNLGLAM